MKKSSIRLLLSPFGISQLIMVAAVGAALWFAYPAWRWERLKDSIRDKYPDVARIDPKGLDDWLRRTNDQKPVLIDIRPKAAFDVSRLPGARNLRPADTPAALGVRPQDDVPLVAYDAVGADASAVAAEYMKLGYRRVQALEGGIFEWANSGLLLEGPTGPASRVATGGPAHAAFLKRRLRAP
jgi:rhodanese-related sulfurtransferase